MKWIKRVTIILTAVCLLCGCTKSNIIRRDGDEDLPQLSPEGILWEQVWEELDSTYADEAYYPFIETVNGMVDTEKKEISLFLLLSEEITAQEAADYATEVIKGLNDKIASQNHDYAFSSDTSYGGYVSRCSIYVMVSLDDTKSDESSWILEDTIPAGEYRPVNPEASPAKSGETPAQE